MQQQIVCHGQRLVAVHEQYSMQGMISLADVCPLGPRAVLLRTTETGWPQAGLGTQPDKRPYHPTSSLRQWQPVRIVI